MKFSFSLTSTLIGLTIFLGSLRLSYWQWTRHQGKLQMIAEFDSRIKLDPEPIDHLIKSPDKNWNQLIHRRALISGEFDFEHEVVLRNRRLDGMAGVFVLTPLVIKDLSIAIIVNRGFIPLSSSTREARKRFFGEKDSSFIGLIKPSSSQRFLAPKDPNSGPGEPWVDEWLRVDLPGIAKQLPYTIAPVWVDIMEDSNLTTTREKIIRSTDGREELLNLAERSTIRVPNESAYTFPVPVYDTIVPAGRHLGYVFEWLAIGIGAILMSILVQLKRSSRDAPSV